MVLRDAVAVAVHAPEVELRLSITGLSTHPQRIDFRRLRLHRRTDGERDQDDGGNEPGGVRHADLLAHDDVMSDPDPTRGWSKPLRKETGRPESRSGHGAPVTARQPGAS